MHFRLTLNEFAVIVSRCTWRLFNIDDHVKTKNQIFYHTELTEDEIGIFPYAATARELKSIFETRQSSFDLPISINHINHEAIDTNICYAYIHTYQNDQKYLNCCEFISSRYHRWQYSVIIIFYEQINVTCPPLYRVHSGCGGQR